jgi:hypothetical protein
MRSMHAGRHADIKQMAQQTAATSFREYLHPDIYCWPMSRLTPRNAPPALMADLS